MPELPEVETIKRDLEKVILQKRIISVQILDRRVIRDIPPENFSKALAGQQIDSILRRGKALVFTLLPSRKMLVVQLMMTGQLVASSKAGASRDKRIVFLLSNHKYLLYNDQRKFGQLRIVRDLKEIKYFRILGPEPLAAEFTKEYLTAALGKTGRPIKNVLLDHTVVAGIGNIYASEILFAAGISPQRPANRLNLSEVKRLHAAIPAILKQAIRFRGTSMRNYRDASGKKGNFLARLQVYGRDGNPCRKCRAQIQRKVMAGRSTFFCPGCQK